MKLPPWLHNFWLDLLEVLGISKKRLYTGIDVSEFNGDVDFQSLK